jgi:hypothetical protein
MLLKFSDLVVCVTFYTRTPFVVILAIDWGCETTLISLSQCAILEFMFPDSERRNKSRIQHDIWHEEVERGSDRCRWSDIGKSFLFIFLEGIHNCCRILFEDCVVKKLCIISCACRTSVSVASTIALDLRCWTRPIFLRLHLDTQVEVWIGLRDRALQDKQLGRCLQIDVHDELFHGHERGSPVFDNLTSQSGRMSTSTSSF